MLKDGILVLIGGGTDAMRLTTRQSERNKS